MPDPTPDAMTDLNPLRLAACLLLAVLLVPLAPAYGQDEAARSEAFLEAVHDGRFEDVEKSRAGLKRTFIAVTAFGDCELSDRWKARLRAMGMTDEAAVQASLIVSQRYPFLILMTGGEMSIHPLTWQIVAALKLHGCEGAWVQQTMAHTHFLFVMRTVEGGWDELNRVERPRRVERPTGEEGRRADAGSAGPDEVFLVVEEPPVLEGGLAALQERLEYPEDLRAAGREGRVMVQFVVGPDGSVRDPEVVRGLHPAADAEALRLIRTARFTPGQQRGRAVSVKMTLPITFRSP